MGSKSYINRTDPTLLLRWMDITEQNLPDYYADEVIEERLANSEITTSASVMILAR